MHSHRKRANCTQNVSYYTVQQRQLNIQTGACDFMSDNQHAQFALIESIKYNMHIRVGVVVSFTLWHMYDPPFFTLSVPDGGPV